MACGTCAVCLCELLPEEEAFLDTCFHHFHLQCIERWVDTQRRQQQAGPLSCPLCRQPFGSAIFDCHGGAFRRKDFAVGPSGGGRGRSASRNGPLPAGSLDLTAAHRRRRAVYSLPMAEGERRQRAQRVAAMQAQQAQRADVAEFVRRELQALLLQPDVEMVAQHVLGTLRNAVVAGTAPRAPGRSGSAALRMPQQAQRAASLRQQGRHPQGPAVAVEASASARPGAVAASGAAHSAGSATQGPPDSSDAVPDAVASVQAAAAPFVFEHAERFAWEVAAFAAAANSSVPAYDRTMLELDASAAAAAGAAARQQLQQRRQQAASDPRSEDDQGPAGGGSDTDSSEGSWWRRRGDHEAQRSDSEGYLDVLLMQNARQRRRQPGAAPTQQLEGGNRQQVGAEEQGGAVSGQHAEQRQQQQQVRRSRDAGQQSRHTGSCSSSGSGSEGRGTVQRSRSSRQERMSRPRRQSRLPSCSRRRSSEGRSPSSEGSDGSEACRCRRLQRCSRQKCKHKRRRHRSGSVPRSRHVEPSDRNREQPLRPQAKQRQQQGGEAGVCEQTHALDNGRQQALGGGDCEPGCEQGSGGIMSERVQEQAADELADMRTRALQAHQWHRDRALRPP